jgi:hypothetical protein
MAAFSKFGMNLSMPSYWGTEWPFSNTAQIGGKWLSQAPGAPYNGGPPLTYDGLGNVTALPTSPAGCYATKFLFSDGNNPPSGDYSVTWQGQGTLGLWSSDHRCVLTPTGPNSATLTIPPNVSQCVLSLLATTPANYLHALKVILPGITPAQESANRYAPDFLKRYRGIDTLRFMDWMLTNGSAQTGWLSRPVVGQDTYQYTGFPIEYLVDLCNQLHCNLWINVPHKGDDTWVGETAEYVCKHLDPTLRVYLEWSNEIWNTIFPQYQYAMDMGVALGYVKEVYGDVPNLPLYRGAWFYQMQRSRQCWSVWQNAMKGRTAPSLVRVINSQAANSFVGETTMLFRNGVQDVDTLSIAPYVGLTVTPTSVPSQATVNTWTPTQVIQHIIDTSLPVIKEWNAQNAAVARKYGIALTSYESGLGINQGGAASSDAHLTALLDEAEVDPLTATLMTDYYRNWSDVGGLLINQFNSPQPWSSSYGRWGIVRHPDGIAANEPRWAVAVDFAQSCGQTFGS